MRNGVNIRERGIHDDVIMTYPANWRREKERMKGRKEEMKGNDKEEEKSRIRK